VKHVGTGDTVSLTLMSSSSMMILKRTLARKIGQPVVLEHGRFVKEDDHDGGYSSFANSDIVGGRELILFMNASLQENPNRRTLEEDAYENAEKRGLGIPVPVKPKAKEAEVESDQILVDVRSLNLGHNVKLKVAKTATIQELKQSIADYVGRPEIVDQAKILRRNADGQGYSSLKDDETIGGRNAFSIMNADIQPAPRSPADLELNPPKAKSKPKAKAKALTAFPDAGEVAPPELVLIAVAHATSTKEAHVELAVMNDVLIGDVKAALAAKLKRPEIATKGRFVQKKGASFGGVRDTELLGDRRSLLFMGAELRR